MRGISSISRSKNRLRHTPAFTLIELLAVVAILAILISLLIPVASRFIQRAQGATCAGNMKQVGAALFAYRADNNGWFPPGYPAAPTAIDAADAQPGQPPQPGMSGITFNSALVPTYLDVLPICPSARTPMGASDWKKGDEKDKLRRLNGNYGINAILIQWKLEAMPYPGWIEVSGGGYSTSKMPFVLETGIGSTTWTLAHQRQALDGVTGFNLPGRNHGKGDMLNFMFLDGHIEMISRNDPRDVDDSVKTWIYPTNPNGLFQAWGTGGRFIPTTELSDVKFREVYPKYFPPAVP